MRSGKWTIVVNDVSGEVARRGRRMAAQRSDGFSLLEAVISLGVVGVLASIALPITVNALHDYRLSAAASAVTGAIQTTRFQAIMHGYQYQLTVTAGALTYQVFKNPGGGLVPDAPAVPIPSAGDVTISRTFTYTFNANGTTQEGNNPPGSFTITNGMVTCTVTVTGVGNVSVSKATGSGSKATVSGC